MNQWVAVHILSAPEREGGGGRGIQAQLVTNRLFTTHVIFFTDNQDMETPNLMVRKVVETTPHVGLTRPLVSQAGGGGGLHYRCRIRVAKAGRHWIAPWIMLVGSISGRNDAWRVPGGAAFPNTNKQRATSKHCTDGAQAARSN